MATAASRHGRDWSALSSSPAGDDADEEVWAIHAGRLLAGIRAGDLHLEVDLPGERVAVQKRRAHTSSPLVQGVLSAIGFKFESKSHQNPELLLHRL